MKLRWRARVKLTCIKQKITTDIHKNTELLTLGWLRFMGSMTAISRYWIRKNMKPNAVYCYWNIVDDVALPWRHNGRDGVSNHQPHDCVLNRSVRRRSKKTSKLRVTGLCAGISPVTSEFPAQSPVMRKNVSIGWRHHVKQHFTIGYIQCCLKRP